MGKAGLFMAPGTGKTITAIRYASRFKHVLVICRRDDFLTWQQELEQECEPEPIKIDSAKDIKKLGSHKWTLVTYGLCRNEKVYKKLREFGFSIIVADEAHSIKRAKSAQTKKVLALSRYVNRRVALTGSPLTNSLQDVWSLAFFIDGGLTFGTKWWGFMKRFFLKLRPPAPPKWTIKRGADAEIMRLLKRIAIHVHEDDVLRLPPIRRVMKAVPMTPQQKRAASQVIDEWEYEIANGELVEINHVVVKVSKLRQIAGGFLYPPKVGGKSQGPTVWFKSNKLAYLKSLVNDELKSKRKIVIWAAFAAEIESIRQALSPNQCVVYYGSDREQKVLARKEFVSNPRVRVFIGQADSGVGMNDLVVADTAIYYSNSDRVVSRQQSERRIRRIGSERHKAITYYDLLTEGSLDVKIYNAVHEKKKLAQSILDGIKKGQTIRELLK